MKISGTVLLLPFEHNVYGIEATNGHQYLPVNMPNQLKKSGLSITCHIAPADVMTSVMWGEPVTIISFETV